MSRFLTLLLVAALACPSCDKLKSLSSRITSAVRDNASATKPIDSTPDPALQKSVDTTTEGVIFRKDVAFPNKIICTTSTTVVLDGRLFNQSELGSNSSEVKGTQSTVSHFERTNDELLYSVKEATFTLPLVEGVEIDPEKPKPTATSPIAMAAPESILFRKTNGKWSATERDFHAMARAKEIAPYFEELLIDHCLAPRPLWFGKRRFKAGDQFTLGNDTMGIFRSKKSTGKLTLVFEKSEAVNGHPCGVFSIKGEFSREKNPEFSGGVSDEEVSIDSGKIWFSLLYPMILKEDYQGVQTSRSGSKGGAMMRVQGKAHVTITRDWKGATTKS
jgi:hypothetical protein